MLRVVYNCQNEKKKTVPFSVLPFDISLLKYITVDILKENFDDCHIAVTVFYSS